MSIFQFIRILWAHRALIAATGLAVFLVGATTVQVVRPVYQAQSRVMLDVVKPDPVTGQVMATNFLRAFTKTQIELVKDPQTARRVVDDLGWAKDQKMVAAYRASGRADDMEFSRWAAQQVASKADARLIEGSNILEISYSSSSPDRAREVADALRRAYVDMTLQARRESARRNAEWYEDQASKARSVLVQTEGAKANFERANGVLLGADKIDIDSARLSALATQAAPVAGPVGGIASAPSAGELARLEAQLAEATRQLGPNHPQLQELRARRSFLVAQVAQERAASAPVAAPRSNAGQLEAQKEKVMAQREKVEQLRLMQDVIDLRRDQYSKALARAAELRQEAEVVDAGVVPLASAVTPQAPIFPKKGLIIGASIPLGLGLGAFLALILEFVGRRVRSAEDLRSAVQVPVLAVIQAKTNNQGAKVWRKLAFAKLRASGEAIAT